MGVLLTRPRLFDNMQEEVESLIKLCGCTVFYNLAVRPSGGRQLGFIYTARTG